MLPMFDLTVPPLIRGLRIVDTYIARAESHVAFIGVSPDRLLNARLTADMYSFSAQVQRVSDNAKNGAARLTGIAAPVFADIESTFRELSERVGETIRFLSALPRHAFRRSGSRSIELTFRAISGTMTGEVYLTKFLLPNFYFHIATAHGILRANDVSVSKQDYLGTLDEALLDDG